MSRDLALLGRIVQLARDPEVCLEEFERAIAASPRLAAEVVRVANSALHGMEGRIQHLQRGVLILGVENVGAIAAAILTSQQLRARSIGAIAGDALWMHSLEIAVCSQVIANWLGLRLEADAFLVGLLHELGMLDLHREHGRRYARLLSQVRPASPLERLEAETLGETHAERVDALMGAWGFPDLLRQAAGFHHAPHIAPEAARPLAALVRAAHAIAVTDQPAFCDAPCDDELDSALRDLDLHPDDAADLRPELCERIKQFTAVV